jgi:cysteine desulfurase
VTESIYLDYCATTPLHPDVIEAMRVPLEGSFGNPSSLHQEGRKAADLLAAARSQVALGIGASEDEIIFTSGATEANNLALRGTLLAQPPERRHLITTAIEHHAVLHTAEKLESEGYQLTILPVDKDGLIDPDHLRQALRQETALVSIMMVNNEIGAVQPIASLASIMKEHDAYFHSDAVQALGTLHVDVDELGIDMLSLSGHKIYGPKGVGALYVRKGVPVEPMITGGPQEYERRAGTENLPGIVGLGKALTVISQHKETEHQRLQALRSTFITQLEEAIPGVIVHGGDQNQAPHIISIAFPGIDAEMLLFHLDQVGIYTSMGSACNAEAIEPSHVLLALGLSEAIIGATLRISIGLWTNQEQLDQVLKVLPELVNRSMDQ